MLADPPPPGQGEDISCRFVALSAPNLMLYFDFAAGNAAHLTAAVKMLAKEFAE
jgi:hypothetical protein